MPATRLSVVIPVYNAQDYIDETLESIFTQDFRDNEIVIVDDGSTDATAAKIRRHSGIKYIYQPNSGGPSRPRNAGIRASSGALIAIFDADDVMLPSKLTLSVAALSADSSAAMVFTNYRRMVNGSVEKACFHDEYETFRSLPRQKVAPDTFRIEGQALFETLFLGDFIGASGVVMRRSVFEAIGDFDESLINSQDYDYWLRICERYPVLYIDKPLHYYRVHTKSISQRSSPGKAINRIKVLEKYSAHPKQRVRRRAIRRIEKILHGLGYQYRCRGEYMRALQSLRQAWRIGSRRKAFIAMAKVVAVAMIDRLGGVRRGRI